MSTIYSPNGDADEYVNKTALVERGWTEAGIKRFLGDPDAERRNKRNRRGPTIKLYELRRVQSAEGSDAWKQWRAQSQTRRNAGRVRAEKDRQVTLAAATDARQYLVLDDAYRGLSYEELTERATASFLAIEERREARSRGRYTAEKVTSRRTEKFFHRIIVNWLRHEGTRYDRNLDEYYNLIGVNIAKDIIRERAYELIAEAYPVLAEECQRQLEGRRATAKRKTGQDVSIR